MKDQDREELESKPCHFEGTDACDHCERNPCPNLRYPEESHLDESHHRQCD